MADGAPRPAGRHLRTESCRLALFEAAAVLRRLAVSGWILPQPLWKQIDATAAALVAEADAREGDA